MISRKSSATRFIETPGKFSLKGIDEVFGLEIEYLKSESIDKIMDSKMNIHVQNSNRLNSSSESDVKVTIGGAKRARFLSEDNCYPSYQVLNFKDLVLQPDYLMTKPQDKVASTSRRLKEQAHNSNTPITNQTGNSFKLIKKQVLESASRKSTERRSILKSKQIDSSIEELSNASLEVCDEDCSDIMCDKTNDLELQAQPINFDFLQKIECKAQNLKRCYENSYLK